MSIKRNSFIYLVSNIFNAAVPFMLLPVLTRVLSQEEYGQIALFMMVMFVMPVFVEFCVVGSVARKYYDYEVEHFSSYVGTVFKIIFTGTVASIVVIMLLKDFIETAISIKTHWLILAVIISLCNSVMGVRLGQWQVRGQAINYGVFTFVKTLLIAVLSLSFVVGLDWGGEGQILAMLYGSILMSTVATYLLYKNKLLIFERNKPGHTKEALDYGVGLIPHILGGFLLLSVDRYIVDRELGISAVGVYMVAYQLSLVFNIIFDAGNKAFVPWLFSLLKRDIHTEKIELVKYTYLSMLVLIIMSIFPFVIGPSILVFVAGDKYIQAGELIGYLCLGQIFNGMYLMVTNYMFFAKKTKHLSFVTIFTGCINLTLLLWLVQYNGLIGVAQSFAIGQCLRFLFSWFLSMKVYPMPWFIKFKREV